MKAAFEWLYEWWPLVAWAGWWLAMALWVAIERWRSGRRPPPPRISDDQALEALRELAERVAKLG
jgi:hypothetical protein